MALHSTPEIAAKGASDFAGDVVELGDDQRLLCPAEVRRLANWLTRGEPGSVYAELVDEEHVRLWPPEAIADALQVRQATLESVADSEEKLRAFADRYRAARLPAIGHRPSPQAEPEETR